MRRSAVRICQGAPINMNRLTVVENFYRNPTDVLSIAEFSPGGCGGQFTERSKPLHELDQNLNKDFSNYICSVLNIDPNHVNVFSYLNKQTFSEANDGSIHIDGRNSVTGEYSKFESYNHLVGGMIFLSEDADYDSGVGLYDDVTSRSDKEKFDFAIRSLYEKKTDLKLGIISKEEFDRLTEEYNSNFKMTCFTSNVYNRMVAWKCGYPHKTILKETQPVLFSHNFYISMV